MDGQKRSELNKIAIKAPDEIISGLLSIDTAESVLMKEERVYTVPTAEGRWTVIAAEGGSAGVTCDEDKWLLESGNAAAFRGENMSVLADEGTWIYALMLHGSIADTIFSEEQKKRGLLFQNGGRSVRRAVNSILAEASRGENSQKTASDMAYSLLTDLYGTGNREQGHKKQLPRVVEAAIGILQNDFAMIDSIGELADRLEVSQEYLTRIFAKTVGITPAKYLNRVRVEYAASLLRRGGHTVSFVSDACGFSNPNYFARVFRSITGNNPGAYINEDSSAATDGGELPDSFYVL